MHAFLGMTETTDRDLFGEGAIVPDGFRYAPDAISPEAEREFVSRFETLPFKQFEFHGYLGNRRVVSYGFRYDYAGRALKEADEMPRFLDPLKSIAANVFGLPIASIHQALVTEYSPGAGIGWHRDKPMFRDVLAFSFLAPCILRLRSGKAPKWKRQNTVIQPRSVYLLRGSAREEWEHSIAPTDRLRYSVTFRTFRDPG